MSEKSAYFRYYLHAYLNQKAVARIFSGDDADTTAYKVSETINYLRLAFLPHRCQRLAAGLMARLEIPLSLLIESALFTRFTLCYALRRLSGRRPTLRGRRILLGLPQRRISRILDNAHIDKREVAVIAYPGMDSALYAGYEQHPLLDGIRYADIGRAYLRSMALTLFMHAKYGKRDMLFRSYSSFLFFLACRYFHTLDRSNTVIYWDTYSRWGSLFGHLPHRTIFLQHGILGQPMGFLKKVGAPDEAYYLNRAEERICRHSLFTRTPSATRYLDGLTFSANEKLLRNGRPNILIVCNHNYLDKERAIVEALLKGCTVNIYIKPHPLDARHPYIELCSRYGCTLLEPADYPEADAVISYLSTLATEYEEAGVRVLRHDQSTPERLAQAVGGCRAS